MSRLRSQINNITLEGGQTEVANSKEVSQSPQPAYATRPNRPQAQPQAPQSSSNKSSSNMKNIQSSLNAIANKVNNLKQTKSQPSNQDPSQGKALVHDDKSAQLEAELQRITNGIEILQNGSGVNSEYLSQMNAELQNLKFSLSKIGNPHPQKVDMPSITKSIEAGYADIASRLDQFLEHSPNSAATQNYDQQFNILNNRIEDISNAVSQINNSSENFADVDAFHRLEARVLSVANTVEQLLQMESSKDPAGIAEVTSSDLEPIAIQIERLSQKVDNIPSMGSVGNNIVSDFEGVMQRLDTLQADFNMLTTHLAQTEEASNANSNDEAAGIVLIEERISELAQKIDVLSQAPANVSGDSIDSQELLPVLRDLVSRVDDIQNAPVPTATVDMSSFETQLASIASQLGTVSNSAATDIQPINDRLDNIESQIASSRDIVIDMASQAAQKAASANDGSGEYTPLENVQLDEITNALGSIAQRLSSIEENSYTAQSNAVATHYVDTHAEPQSDLQSREVAHEVAGEIDDSPLLQGEPHVTTNQDADVNYGEITNAPSMDENYAEKSVLEPTEQSVNVGATGLDENSAPIEDVPLEPGSGMPDIEALVRRATERKKQENSHSVENSSETSSDLVAQARRAAQAASLEAQSNNGFGNTNTDKQSKISKFLKRGKKANAKTAEVVSAPEIAPVNENVDAGEVGQSKGKLKQIMMASVAAIALGFVAYTVVPKFLNSSSAPTTDSAAISSTAPQSSLNEVLVNEVNEGNLQGSDTDLASNMPAIDDAKQAPTDLAARDMMSPQGTSNTANSGETGFDAPRDLADDVMGDNLGAPAAAKNNASDLPAATAPSTSQNAGPVPPKEVGNSALIQAATNGDQNAIFEVGHRYSDGIGVKRSFEDAAKWYELAASKGHALSQYRIGNFYEKGHGVKADPEKAAIWYEQSANQGNALAMHNLAVLNAQGVIGTQPNMDRAVELFEKAADLGVKDSQVNLGIMYTQGMGADKNLEAAYKWFAIANRAGDQDAGKKRDIVGNAMRPEQLKNARAQAESWKPQPINMAANTATPNPAWTNGGNTAKISKKDIIRKTQSLLTRAGFDPGPADGLFGLKTRDAIISFQKRAGMEGTGEISPELLKALSKVST